MKFPSVLVYSILFAGVDAKASKLAEARAQRRLNVEFMSAMHANPKVGSARRKHSEKQRRDTLYKNLVENARKLQNNQDNYNGQGADGQWYDQEAMEQMAEGRYWNGQYWVDADFDMTARAFKYAGCAAIKSFDTEKAEENGNPMVIDTYAVFRLCPAESCNKYSMTGCGKNYGEYAVEMKTYLTYILEYYQNRYDQYCEYCEPCDYEYQLEAKENMELCYDQLNEQEWQQNQQIQQQAWEQYYNENNGDMSNYNAGNSAYNGGDGLQGYGYYYNGAQNQQGGYNANANNGNRKMQNYNYNGYNQNMNNGYNQNMNNGYNQNMNNGYNQNNVNAQNAQNNNGYYDQYGNWVDGQQQQNGGNQQQQQQNGGNQQHGYWGADGIWYDGENAQYQGYQTYMVQCKDGSYCDYCEQQQEEQYLYCDEYTCGDYYTYCTDMFYGEPNDFDVYDYLECQPYDNEYGQRYYIGPHCGSNHYTISLGVFSDENCVNYIGESVSLKEVLGYQYDDDDLFQIPKDCISCDGTEQYEENLDEGESIYGEEYVSAPDTDEDGVVAMCSALYERSAQCNQHLENYEQMARMMSIYELEQEERYCAFIENIVYGAYDEQGEILLKPEQFDFNDWRNAEQYKKLKIPASQAILLAGSVILVVALLATIFVTQRTLKRQSTPWRPKQGTLDPNDLSRQNSGIVMGRSRSGPSSGPLI